MSKLDCIYGQFEAGDEIACTIMNTFIADAKLQYENDRWYVCQNIKSGNDCNDKLGYRYSWSFSVTEVGKLTEGVEYVILKNGKNTKPVRKTVTRKNIKFTADTDDIYVLQTIDNLLCFGKIVRSDSGTYYKLIDYYNKETDYPFTLKFIKSARKLTEDEIKELQVDEKKLFIKTLKGCRIQAFDSTFDFKVKEYPECCGSTIWYDFTLGYIDNKLLNPDSISVLRIKSILRQKFTTNINCITKEKWDKKHITLLETLGFNIVDKFVNRNTGNMLYLWSYKS